ncbi:MAG TPA: hypothetical protein VFB06_12540 [Streptosporangiaceae bacterium]|nr:hypothetical protein [Streptosporangiaceae bacterium]
MDARAAGDRVETLLAELRSRAGPDAAGTAEELVSCLVQLYGEGLATIMRLAAEDERLVAQLIADPLVESLLLIHDLHPLDTAARIRRALGTGAELVGITDDGVVQIKLASGCGHTAAAVEQAVTDAAPETAGVDFAPRDPPLLQIARRRPAGAL